MPTTAYERSVSGAEKEQSGQKIVQSKAERGVGVAENDGEGAG